LQAAANIHLNHPPDILLFIGRLHPLLVHLPIGMLTALAALEIAARVPRFKNAAASAGYLLALAAPLAVVTACCGWLLSLGGGYDKELLAWHKWLGTGTAVAAVVTAILFQRGKITAYRVSLFVTVSLLLAAGHLGGSLTHGRDYLTRYAPAPLRKLLGLPAIEKSSGPVSAADLRQLPVFTGVIEPIFRDKCVACHGPDKSKGGLRLDSFAAVRLGGNDDAALTPGNAAGSPLMRRALLPAGDDHHMPPDGKPQLTASEIALLKWWINAGAPETNTLGQLRPPPEIFAALSAR
jgi:uncharacterized membrane protein